MIRMHPQSRRMRLADLVPAEYNPRTISAEAMAGLTASIEPYGSEADAVTIHGLEGTPLRGLVIETPWVVFACDLGGRLSYNQMLWMSTAGMEAAYPPE